MTFCLRPTGTEEGQGNTPCTVHLEVADLGNHEIEIGHTVPGGFESHCEPGLPFEVWIEDAHFRYEAESQKGQEGRIEIIH